MNSHTKENLGTPTHEHNRGRELHHEQQWKRSHPPDDEYVFRDNREEANITTPFEQVVADTVRRQASEAKRDAALAQRRKRTVRRRFLSAPVLQARLGIVDDDVRIMDGANQSIAASDRPLYIRRHLFYDDKGDRIRP